MFIFKAIVLNYISIPIFYCGSKCSKVLNKDVHGTAAGLICGKCLRPNDMMFQQRLRNANLTSFLNSTVKYIKRTLTDQSKLNIELQHRKCR